MQIFPKFGTFSFLFLLISEVIGQNELSGSLEMPDLGRRFSLGCLYDARRDEIVPGYSLWNISTIKGNIQMAPAPSTEFNVIASDDFKEKAHAFDLSASIKASFLSGMIEVKGAAKYLKDQAESHHKTRVSLDYTKKTHYQELGSDLHHYFDYPMVFDKDVATHVVNRIQYGAKVTSIFEADVEELAKKRKIYGELHIAVNLASGALDISGQGHLNLTSHQKKKYSEFNVKFYGDIAIPLAPTKYNDAINIYKQLPTIINQDTAVPVKVNMIPLGSLDRKALKILRQISARLLKNVETRLGEYEELEKSAGDLMHQSQAYSHLPSLRSHVRAFKNALEVDKNIFQRQIAEILPRIRGGGAEEDKLSEVFIKSNRSPYNLKKQKLWIEAKKREAGALQSMFTWDKSLIATQPGSLEKLLFGTEHEHIMAISLEFYPSKDMFTTCMLNRMAPECASGVDYHSWLDDAELSSGFTTKFAWLQNLRESNRKNNTKITFAIAEHTPLALDARDVTLRWYRGGELRERDFQPPRIVNLTNKIRGRFVELSWKTEGSVNLITGYNLMFRAFPNGTWEYYISKNPTEHFFRIRLPSEMPEFDFAQEYLFEIRVEPACEFGYGISATTYIRPTKCWSPWISYDSPLMVDGPAVVKHGVDDSTVAIVGWQEDAQLPAAADEDEELKGVPEIFLRTWNGETMNGTWRQTWIKSSSTPSLIHCPTCPLKLGIFYKKFQSGNVWYAQLPADYQVSSNLNQPILWQKVGCCKSWTNPTTAYEKHGRKQVHLFITDLDGTLTHRAMSYTDIKRRKFRRIRVDKLLRAGSGTVVTSSSAGVYQGNNKLHVFIRGGTGSNSTNLLRSLAEYNEFSPDWPRMGCDLLYAPGAVSWSAGRVDVFVVNRDQTLNQYFYEESLAQWKGPINLGGVLTSAPVAVSVRPDTIDVFARGANMKLVHIQRREKYCFSIRGVQG